MDLILSLFPGIDLFGRAFEAEGYCVVRGPDLIFGQDIRTFHAPPRRFNGIIGGPPCVQFSSLNRQPDPAAGMELINEFLRVVDEAQPLWFLMEGVPRTPSVVLDGYTIQRLDLCGTECGLKQRRLRHFHFGCGRGGDMGPLIMDRINMAGLTAIEPACTASEGRRAGKRPFARFCELMGLPDELELPGMSRAAKYRAVGNGVPLPMGRMLARGIRRWFEVGCTGTPCGCGCGRSVTGRRKLAGPACRKRMQRRREAQTPGQLVTDQATAAIDASLFGTPTRSAMGRI